jgi:hypothetical protein
MFDPIGVKQAAFLNYKHLNPCGFNESSNKATYVRVVKYGYYFISSIIKDNGAFALSRYFFIEEISVILNCISKQPFPAGNV